MIFFPGSSQSPTISGGAPTHTMETRNSYGRSGNQLSTTLPTSITGTVQNIIMNIPTHQSQEMWLRPGSPAHEALKESVFDQDLLKDIQQLTLSCHTGSLEVYHSVQTKYLPKRQHVWYRGMVARTQLATLGHNASTSRDLASASRGENKGELHFKVVFPKRSKEWIAKPIM